MLAVSFFSVSLRPACAFPGAGFLKKNFHTPKAQAVHAVSVETEPNTETKQAVAGEPCDAAALGLTEAMDLAVLNHRQARVARERLGQAKGRMIQSVSELLPMLTAGAGQRRVGRENLEAMGFKHGGMIGPFSAFDARFYLTMKLFDMSAVLRIREGHAGVVIARLEEEFSRREVMQAAAIAYVYALGTDGQLRAARADLELSRRLWRLAKHQRGIGMATGVDVIRAQTRVAEERVRVQQALKARYEAFLQLQRIAGIGFDEAIRLSDSLRFFSDPHPEVGEAVASAKSERIETRIADEALKLSRQRLWEERLERVPKLEFAGDYGLTGLQPNDTARQVGQAMLRVSVPIFEGGRRFGLEKEAGASVRESEIEQEDVGRQVEEDVRLAIRALETGIEEVRAARSVVTLAGRELEMARERFAVGVGDNIEVLAAQTALAHARSVYVDALVGYHDSRINLYSALGRPQVLRLARCELKPENQGHA